MVGASATGRLQRTMAFPSVYECIQYIYIYISFIIIPCFAPHELAVLVPFCPTGERLGGDVDVRRGGRTVRQAEPHQRSPTQADRSVGGAEASSFGAERGEGQFTG